MKKSLRPISTYSCAKMIRIVKNVCESYASGQFTLESVCENAGVPYRTFKHWWEMYDQKGSNNGSRWSKLAEVAGLWEAAQTQKAKIRDEKLRNLSETMLEKRITGYNYEEVTTRIARKLDADGQEMLIPVGLRKVTKHVPPSDKAIQFTLTRLCPEKYGERNFSFEISTNNPLNINRPIEEIQAEILRIEAELRTLEGKDSYDDIFDYNQ